MLRNVTPDMCLQPLTFIIYIWLVLKEIHTDHESLDENTRKRLANRRTSLMVQALASLSGGLEGLFLSLMIKVLELLIADDSMQSRASSPFDVHTKFLFRMPGIVALIASAPLPVQPFPWHDLLLSRRSRRQGAIVHQMSTKDSSWMYSRCCKEIKVCSPVFVRLKLALVSLLAVLIQNPWAEQTGFRRKKKTKSNSILSLSAPSSFLFYMGEVFDMHFCALLIRRKVILVTQSAICAL